MKLLDLTIEIEKENERLNQQNIELAVENENVKNRNQHLEEILHKVFESKTCNLCMEKGQDVRECLSRSQSQCYAKFLSLWG